MGSLSQGGYEWLKRHEGYKNVPYHLPGERYYTVGIGHFGADVVPGRFYSNAEVDAFFARDKVRFENSVNRVWHQPMTQQMFDALFFFAYSHGNVDSTVLGRACLGDGWQNVARISAIWKSSYLAGGKLIKRRAEEVAYFYGMADTGGAFDAGGAGGILGGIGGSDGASAAGFYTGDAGGYVAGQQNNGYATYNSVYAGAELNTGRVESTVYDSSGWRAASARHTRIYKYSDSSVMVDELSIPMDITVVDSSSLARSRSRSGSKS